jgi:peptide/nickel transport system permease protein
MRGIDLGYFLKRVGMFIFVVYIAATINFLIPRLAPGNPIGAITSRVQQASAGIEGGEAMYEAYREMFGLNDPLPVQYINYLWNTVRLELGYSLSAFPAGVWEVIRPAIPWTIGLIAVSVLITFFLGVGAGALLAWRGTPRMVKLFIPVSMVFAVLPYYLLALLLLYALAFTTGLFPMGGAYSSRYTPGWDLDFIMSVGRHAVLPGLSIVLSSLGLWALTMRALMVNTIGEDYMLLADAKGLKNRRILWWYAVRNAIPPQLTNLAISLGHVVSGAILVEIIFAYPGLGYLLYMSITNSDYTVIQGITLMLAVSVGLAVLIIDLIYPRLDPRVTYVAESSG